MKKPKKPTASLKKFYSDLNSGVKINVATQALTARQIQNKTILYRTKALNIVNKSYKYKTTTVKRGDKTYTKKTALKASVKEIGSYYTSLKDYSLLDNSNIKSKAAFVRAFKKSSVSNQVFLKNLASTSFFLKSERDMKNDIAAGKDNDRSLIDRSNLLTNKLAIKTVNKETGQKRLESLVTKHTGKSIALIESKGKINIHKSQANVTYTSKHWKLVDKSSDEYKKVKTHIAYLSTRGGVSFTKLHRIVKQMRKSKDFKEQELGNKRWIPIINEGDKSFTHFVHHKPSQVGEKINVKKVLLYETVENLLNLKKADLQIKIKNAKGKQKKILKEKYGLSMETPEGAKLAKDIFNLNMMTIRMDLLEDRDYKSFTKRWVDDDGVEHVDTSDWTAYWARKHNQEYMVKRIQGKGFHSIDYSTKPKK